MARLEDTTVIASIVGMAESVPVDIVVIKRHETNVMISAPEIIYRGERYA
ncbi:MAG: hypothetical protein LBC85_00335 [Fibromonadaceae bacterium]|jgi:phosphoribosylcarboxyaminoimidazole (NCAIR) mutase|nr:hypothetical protein [Fibromonadaceae bacterium]